MSTDTQTMSPVEAAKLVRADLRAAFPGIKFSLTGSRGTGYGWYHLSWTDGPTAREVRDAVTVPFGNGRYGVNVNMERRYSRGLMLWAESQVSGYDATDYDSYSTAILILADTNADGII